MSATKNWYVAIIATITLGLMSATVVTAQPALGVTPRPSIDMNDRASVIASFEAEFNRVEPAMEWTGNLSECNGGTTSAAYQQSVLQRVNWHRQMAGVADVGYAPELNAQQQAGALISAANGSLSHNPPSTHSCWTQAGYASTSSSNLYLGVNGIDAMTGYIKDPGANNTFVGHRWWVLHPMLKTITSGDLPATAGKKKSNALHVFNTAREPVQSPRDGFVAWPPPGFVPDDVVFPRWSLKVYGYGYGAGAVPTPDFTNATVNVTGPNGPLTVTYEDRSSGRIVFVPSGFERAPIQLTSDQKYTVDISGVTGGPVTTYSYNVTVIPTNSAPTENGWILWAADSCAAMGSRLAGPSIRDVEGDAVTVTLAAGDGDTDNSKFAFMKTGSSYVLTPLQNLDGSQKEFSVRYRATDIKGAFFENRYTLLLKSPETADGLCPKKTSIVTSPTTSPPSVADTAFQENRRTRSGVIRRGKVVAIRSYVQLPAGKHAYKITGNCKLSRTKKSVIAPKSKGNCTLTITRKSSTKTYVTVLKLRVK